MILTDKISSLIFHYSFKDFVLSFFFLFVCLRNIENDGKNCKTQFFSSTF